MSAYRFTYLKILVVDDNRNMLGLLQDILRAMGVGEVVTADNGASAIEILTDSVSTPVDIVITDLSMEPMDGDALTRWIRNDPNSPNRFLPVILLTGHTELGKILAMRDAGVTEVLAKPININGLTNRILNIIDRPRRFVDAAEYFGPDRRRHTEPYSGQEKRKD